MDPISLGAMPRADFGAQEPPVPQPPDASDVQEFQDLYNQDGVAGHEAPQARSFQGMLINMMGGPLPGAVTDNVFQAAMERMAEMHEKNCSRVETLIDRIASSTSLSPQDMLEAQMVLSDAAMGLATYQSFDKKADEGIKTLMTGQ
jgi:hypothetical protein